jgi:glycosyltransferase involved in cell wall biosynthesis
MHSSLPQQLTNFGFTRSKALIGLFDRLERSALKSAEAVITICPELQDYALAHGVEPGRHLLIENSIFDDVRLNSLHASTSRNPATEAEALEAALSSGAPLIVYAGTFEPYQGLELLLCAFAEVVKQRPDVRLIMIGGEPAQVEQKEQFADAIGLGHSCIFTGQRSKTETIELSARAHVFVSPRVTGTNTPLKLYEQLASGKPLVATRVSSHTQVLSDDVCFLVEPEPVSMADGILLALETGPDGPHVVNARLLYERVYSRPAYEAKVRRLLEILP